VRARIDGRLLALCLSLCGCDTKANLPAQETSPERTASAAQADAFQSPDADGFGRAAGLRYLEIVRGDRADARLPMVVMIHGMGDRARADWLDAIGVTQPARFILPEAPDAYGDGYSWFGYKVRGDNPQSALADSIASATERVARALEVLRAQRPTLGRPIVTGFSQGGMLSFALALRHPELIELAQPISGTLPEPLWPTAKAADDRRPPIRALHGTADEIVPIDGPRGLTAKLQALGYDAKLEEFPDVGHHVSAPMTSRSHQTLDAALQALAASR
jgi:phospholipase/carboxylesterase